MTIPLDRTPFDGTARCRPTSGADVVSTDWRHGLPVLTGTRIVLREIRLTDAPSLFALLTTEEVARFIWPPPESVEAFAAFIAWAIGQRTDGRSVCFAATVDGSDTAVGIFQVRALAHGFSTAEWGFAIGSAYWGTGLFQDGAALIVKFAFETLGVHRLEARALAENGRGSGALRTIGAVQEGLLLKSFLRDGEYVDQVLYTILEEDRRGAKAA